MSDRYHKFKADMKVYEAIESSPVGDLLRKGVEHNFCVTTDSIYIEAQKHHTDENVEHYGLEDFGEANDIIDFILVKAGINISSSRPTKPITVKTEYAYLIYEKKENGPRILIFGSSHTPYHIFKVRENYLKDL